MISSQTQSARATQEPLLPFRFLVTFVLIGSVVVFNMLFVTVPFYASGMHLMTTGEIYEANNNTNLVVWYFLYHDWNFYIWAAAALMLYELIAIPLFIALCFAAKTRWNTLTPSGRRMLIVGATLFLSQFVVYWLSHEKIGAWLFD